MLQARRSQVRLPMGTQISFSVPNPSSHTMALRFTQPVAEISTGRFLGRKRGQRVRLTA
jgi:hypothetical protein